MNRIVKVKVIVSQPEPLLVKVARQALICSGAVISLSLMGLTVVAVANNPVFAGAIVGFIFGGVLRR